MTKIDATTGSGAAASRPQRADARRNAERVLVAAHEVFDEQGSDASLEEIARRAGVGIGTLYRHFPTRDVLVQTVMQEELDALEARAAALLASDDPGEALAVWLREHLAAASVCRGLGASAMIKMLDHEGAALPCESMRRAGAALVARAQEAGVVRADVDIDDLMRLVNAIGLATEDAPNGPAQAEHLLAVVIDGIRAE
jgi:AcrR family transcriptional regulator